MQKTNSRTKKQKLLGNFSHLFCCKVAPGYLNKKVNNISASYQFYKMEHKIVYTFTKYCFNLWLVESADLKRAYYIFFKKL